jgi:hypothetical protein
MRVARLILSVSISFLLSLSLVAQQSTTSSSQALTLLQNSLAALTGGQAISDVTLSGTARRIAGSDDDTGKAVFKALASGMGRTDLSLSSGQRSEIHDLSAAEPTGAWSGPDGVSHVIVFHNLLTESAWFFPAFAIARRVSRSSYVATYVGHETQNGQSVEHISVAQTSSDPTPEGQSFFGHLSQVHFFLDSTTLLPVAFSFNIHPDNNALLDIPVEVRFSDYRPVNGTQIPFHVQKYLNNTLQLDLQFQTATVNSGLTAATFKAL